MGCLYKPLKALFPSDHNTEAHNRGFEMSSLLDTQGL